MLRPVPRTGSGLDSCSLGPGFKVLDRAVRTKDAAQGVVAPPAEEPPRLVFVLGVEDFFIVTGPEPDGDWRTSRADPHEFTDDVVDSALGTCRRVLMVHTAGKVASANGRDRPLATLASSPLARATWMLSSDRSTPV